MDQGLKTPAVPLGVVTPGYVWLMEHDSPAADERILKAFAEHARRDEREIPPQWAVLRALARKAVPS